MSTKMFNEIVEKYTSEESGNIHDGNSLAAEVGALCDVLRDIEAYQNDPDVKKRIDIEVQSGGRKDLKARLMEESGDALFLIFRIMQRNGITFDDVAEDQKHKLRGKSISQESTFKK